MNFRLFAAAVPVLLVGCARTPSEATDEDSSELQTTRLESIELEREHVGRPELQPDGSCAPKGSARYTIDFRRWTISAESCLAQVGAPAAPDKFVSVVDRPLSENELDRVKAGVREIKNMPPTPGPHAPGCTTWDFYKYSPALIVNGVFYTGNTAFHCDDWFLHRVEPWTLRDLLRLADELAGFAAPFTPFQETVSLAQNELVSFAYDVPPGTYVIALTGAAEASLYVRKNHAVTPSAYDCRPGDHEQTFRLGNTNESCTVVFEEAGKVHVSVRGVLGVSRYTLKGSRKN